VRRRTQTSLRSLRILDCAAVSSILDCAAVSNHEATMLLILRDAAKTPLLRMRESNPNPVSP